MRALGALVLAFVATGIAVGPGRAVASPTYAAVAAASGVRSAVVSHGFLIVEEADGGSPSAQALLDSTGTSTGYAAAPYPTDTGITGYGMVSAAAGGRGDYPLIAQSTSPTRPQASVDQPGVQLAARSLPMSSSATAEDGRGGDTSAAHSSASSAVTYDATSTALTARGIAEVDGFAVAAGVLRIGHLHSLAKAITLPDGTTRLESELVGGEMSVAGQPVQLTDRGLVSPAGTTTAPQLPVDETLAQAGVTVRVVAPAKDKDGRGIVSGALEVQVTRQVTPTGDPTTVRYVFGRSYARVAFTGAATHPLTGPVDTGTDTSAGGTSPTPPASALATGRRVPSLSSPFGSATPLVTERRTAPVPQSAGTRLAAGVPQRFSAAAFYLALVVAAASVAVIAHLVRLLGVRSSWTS